MGLPTVEQTWNDPDFQGLPTDEKRNVLASIDPDFSKLGPDEQNKVLGVHSITFQEKIQDVAAKINGILKNVDQLGSKDGLAPGANELTNQGNNLFNQIGGNFAEFMGKKGYPMTGAAIGTGLSMLNPQNFMSTQDVTQGINVGLKPATPPPDLASTGIPFTRADITRSPIASSLESSLVKTPTGAGPIEQFRNLQASKIQDYQTNLQNQYGTNQPSIVTGNMMRDSAIQEHAVNNALSQSLYNDIPKDVRLPTPLFGSKYLELADEMPSQLSKIVNKHTTVNQAPSEAVGSGTGQYAQTPLPVVDPKNLPEGMDRGAIFIGNQEWPGMPSQALYDIVGNHPLARSTVTLQSLREHGIPVIGRSSRVPEGVVPAEMGPTGSPSNPVSMADTPTIHDLMTLRSKLTSEQQGPNRYWATELKRALNQDIENLGKNSSDPLAQMIGQHVQDSLAKATNYYREMKQLQNHPIAQSLQNAPIENVPDILFKSGRSEDVLVGRSVLGDAAFQAARKSFYTDLLHKRDIGKELSKYDPEFLNQALSQDQIGSLALMDKVKKTALGAEKMAPMTGSSRMNAILALFGTAGAAAMKGHPLGATLGLGAGLLGPAVASRLYLGTTGGLPQMINSSAGALTGLSNQVPASSGQ